MSTFDDQYDNLIAPMDSRNIVKKLDDNYCFPNLFKNINSDQITVQTLIVDDLVITGGTGSTGTDIHIQGGTGACCYAYNSGQYTIGTSSQEQQLSFNGFVLGADFSIHPSNERIIYNGATGLFQIQYQGLFSPPNNPSQRADAFMKITINNADIPMSASYNSFNIVGGQVNGCLITQLTPNSEIELFVCGVWTGVGTLTMNGFTLNPLFGGSPFTYPSNKILFTKVAPSTITGSFP